MVPPSPLPYTHALIVCLKLTLQSLKADLNEYLAAGHIDPLTKPPTAVLKPTSRQIQVNGRWVPELKGWLEMKGF